MVYMNRRRRKIYLAPKSKERVPQVIFPHQPIMILVCDVVVVSCKGSLSKAMATAPTTPENYDLIGSKNLKNNRAARAAHKIIVLHMLHTL